VSKHQNLKTIQALADTAAAESSKEVAQSLARLHQEEKRLAQLVEYLADYRAREHLDRAEQSIACVRSRRRFIERLGEAIGQQKQLVAQYQLLHEEVASRWQDARSHSLGLRKYTDRVEHREEIRRARRDQARLDEIGARNAGH